MDEWCMKIWNADPYKMSQVVGRERNPENVEFRPAFKALWNQCRGMSLKPTSECHIAMEFGPCCFILWPKLIASECRWATVFGLNCTDLMLITLPRISQSLPPKRTNPLAPSKGLSIIAVIL